MFNWGWYMGMLRSDQEYDLIMTLAYSGKGTMQVGGQPCNVTMYRSDINYKMSGERIRITGTRPNGQSCSTIEVVSGAYTWNEDIMGAELVPGKGKATPMPATVEDRMIRLWAGPQGAFKAAFAGTSPDAPPMTPRPQQLAADVMTIAKTTVALDRQQAGADVPDPGRPQCHGDHHARRQVHARERRGEKRQGHLRVHLQRLQGLEQSTQSGRGVCTPAG